MLLANIMIMIQGGFALPHPDALDKQRNQDVVNTIDDFLSNIKHLLDN